MVGLPAGSAILLENLERSYVKSVEVHWKWAEWLVAVEIKLNVEARGWVWCSDMCETA